MKMLNMIWIIGIIMLLVPLVLAQNLTSEDFEGVGIPDGWEVQAGTPDFEGSGGLTGESLNATVNGAVTWNFGNISNTTHLNYTVEAIFINTNLRTSRFYPVQFFS